MDGYQTAIVFVVVAIGALIFALRQTPKSDGDVYEFDRELSPYPRRTVRHRAARDGKRLF
jgi:hypothetical protein